MTGFPSPREKLLDAAEQLFTLHGLAGVRLRDLEQAAGLHHATFYHHVPGGKTQLYIEAMDRALARHEAALGERLEAHGGDLRAQLFAVAEWVLTNPAGNHTRMLSTDLPRLPPDSAERLAQRAYRALVGPLALALRGRANGARPASPRTWRKSSRGVCSPHSRPSRRRTTVTRRGPRRLCRPRPLSTCCSTVFGPEENRRPGPVRRRAFPEEESP